MRLFLVVMVLTLFTSALACAQQPATQESSATHNEAAKKWVAIYKKINPTVSIPYFKMDKTEITGLSQSEIKNIALQYKIIDNAASVSSQDIRLGLLKGSDIDIPGIGVGYLSNARLLNLDSHKWYWELGACSTNRRVFVNAETGAVATIVHKYVYCGGVP